MRISTLASWRGAFAALLSLPIFLHAAPTAVDVQPVHAAHGIVVAGHPEAAAIGVDVLRRGGNAADAAIAVSLALGVAEPYGSGLGGKLMLLHHERSTGRTTVIDAMDAAPSSLDADAARRWTAAQRNRGLTAVAIPGLPAGLGELHQRFGTQPWSDLVEPARALAETGALIAPKTHELFAERLDRLEADAELARIYLPDGKLPEIGQRLPNLDLARSLALLAEDGAASFYAGRLADHLVAGTAGEGGFTRDDLAAYRVSVTDAVRMPFAGFTLVSSPPPTTGAAMYFPVLKIVEPLLNTDEPLRSAANLELLARAWGHVQPRIYAEIGDRPESRERFESLLDETYVRDERTWLQTAIEAHDPVPALEDTNASTTHFVIVDANGNIVTATQSLSLHFGAGCVAQGTGIVLNNSMSNFDYRDPANPNAVTAGQRPRSTICPTLAFGADGTVIAIGLPGGARIPTAMLQVLLDRLLWRRPLDEAIGDVRFHIDPAWRNDGVDAIECEIGLDPLTQAQLLAAGFSFVEPEPAGTGLHFGGVNAIEIAPDGSLTGFADPRRSNAAAGF